MVVLQRISAAIRRIVVASRPSRATRSTATSALALSLPAGAAVSGLMTAAIVAATWKLSPRRG